MSFDISLSPPDVGELEQDFVLAAMRSGWAAPAGPDLDAFEAEIAERVGAAHAVGLASGTAALHLALVSWGIGPGDVVPVSTLTFAASVNAIKYVGAEPYFIDCDLESGNMRADLLRRGLTQLRSEGRNVPAVVSVDLFGKCVDYDSIASITADVGAKLLADSAESLGSKYGTQAAGSFGDASALSFNGNKILTTSGGGMLLTDDDALATHVRKLATQARESVVHYEHTEIGYNYRLSNILAALGRAQLARLDGMLARRRTWRTRYQALFVDQPGIRILGGTDDAGDNCWLTPIVVNPKMSSWTAQDLRGAMADAGIETRPVWKPMHLQPVFQGLGGVIDGTSEMLFEQSLVLPSGSSMNESQFGRIEELIRAVIER